MDKAMEDIINGEKLKIAANLLALETVSKEDIAKITMLPLDGTEEFADMLKTRKCGYLKFCRLVYLRED